jgi:LuxR family maltose regulon positive regulatory protein
MKAIWQARLYLERGEIEAASQWVAKRKIDSSDLPENVDYLLLFDYVLLARILIAQKKLNEAVGLLQQLEVKAVNGGRTTSVIEILTLQALAHQSGGNTSQAIDTLKRALEIAEPLGYFRIFVDEGQTMLGLLFETYQQDIAPDYVQRLLAAFPDVETKKIGSTGMQASESELVEPLSERELEVLDLIAEGLTNPEIAARLYLSPHTVKVHTRNIYGKIGAHNRVEAVSRARALGIMPST